MGMEHIEEQCECTCGHSADGICHCRRNDWIPVINDYDEQEFIDNLADWD